MLDPHGPVGKAERVILYNSTAIMLAVVIPVIVLTLVFAWWFRAAIAMGPFANGDTGPIIIVGMTLVSAMAIQNAANRIHLSGSPPTTIMTGTTTRTKRRAVPPFSSARSYRCRMNTGVSGAMAFSSSIVGSRFSAN